MSSSELQSFARQTRILLSTRYNQVSDWSKYLFITLTATRQTAHRLHYQAANRETESELERGEFSSLLSARRKMSTVSLVPRFSDALIEYLIWINNLSKHGNIVNSARI